MSPITRLARAKINLSLWVGAVDSSGYHPLDSWVAFADIGDEIRLYPDGTGPILSLSGPFTVGIGADDNNLVIKALRVFEHEMGQALNVRIELTKNLPIASGLGGGTADAGAVLRGLRDLYAPGMYDDRLAHVAAKIGADGVMCLWSHAGRATGYGEHFEFHELPSLAAVLFNPGVACPTSDVYRRFDALPRRETWTPITALILEKDSFITQLIGMGNDLEPAAFDLCPILYEVIADLRQCPGARLARMSGSGATCFAVFDTLDQARAATKALELKWHKAWIKAVTLS